MNAVGIDIGTTSICGTVLALETGETLKTILLENDTFLPAENSWERMQDPDKILNKSLQLVNQLCGEYPSTVSIGVTGQMHGILYLDKDGRAVSPLYTWQDGRSEQLSPRGITYLEELRQKTGYPVYSGYGFATHYTISSRDEVPESAVLFCTIGDYLAMRLAGKKFPLLHPSNMAGLGCFQLEENRLDIPALTLAGINPAILPKLCGKEKLGEFHREGRTISVAPAIGDNQASFYGSVSRPEDTVLVNIGTGGQISVFTSHLPKNGPMEIRPAANGGYLLAGASLCGGRAYAILERFFRQVLEMAGVSADGTLYKKMEQTLDACENKPLSVSTRFAGTRRNPEERGMIAGIGENNFTPANLITGVLDGIARELFDLYIAQGITVGKPVRLVGSGNGIRKNPALCRTFEKIFGCPLLLTAHTEEAAVGAALYSCVISGIMGEEQARELISPEATPV